MEDYWKKNVRNALNHIADLEYQRNSWLGLDLTIVSSFDEVINVLLGDNCFEDFIQECKNENLDDRFVSRMSELKDKLLSYPGKDKAAEDILADPAWQSIARKAKYILDEWEIVHDM